MSNSTIKQYQDIAALNRETYLFLNQVHMLKENDIVKKNRILITMETEGSANNGEWTGFVSTIKNFIKKNSATSN